MSLHIGPSRKSFIPLILKLAPVLLAFGGGLLEASSTPVQELRDFWRLPHLQGKLDSISTDKEWKSPYFWEVSYYQFYNAEKQLGGNISIFVLSPRFNPKLTVIGSFHRLGRQTEFFRQFRLSESWMDPASADIIAQDGSDRIEVLNSGARLRLRIQEVAADLKVDAPIAGNWLREYRFPQTANLARISPSRFFDYHLTWLPLSPQASYSGSFQTDEAGTEIQLAATSGYHDRLWGVWNPGAQPYQWISFLARSQSGEKFEGLVGYFPGLNDFGGAWIRDDERTYFCDPSRIRSEVKETASILPTRFNPLEKAQVFHREPVFSSPAQDAPPSSATQIIPKRTALALIECRAPGSDTVLTGIFDIQAQRMDSKGLDLPGNLGSILFNDFSITDLDARVTGFISRNSPGAIRRMNTVQGAASLQAIAGGEKQASP